MDEQKAAELLQKAAQVLKQNDRGGWTVPAGDLYPHQWLWDSCFIAIGQRHLDIERAQAELVSLLRGQWANGMMPDMIFSSQGANLDQVLWDSAISPYAPHNLATSGITQPPMLAEAVMLVGKKLKLPERRSWFKKMLPGLIGFHEWLYSERDPKHESLITLLHPYESGLDNSPPWIEELNRRGIPWWVMVVDKLHLGFFANLARRDLRFSPIKQRMSNVEALAFLVALRRLRRKAYDSQEAFNRPYLAIQDLVFNSVLIRANSCLKEISVTAGQPLPASLLASTKLSQTALDSLWDEPSSQYYSRSFTSGELIKESTVATLLPLYAGTISQERGQTLVELLNRRQFFKTNWPVPSVPTNSSYFDPIKYWQGPSWINVNWLIIQGLKRYDFNKEAEHLTQRTLELVAKSSCAEYFNSISGEPLGARSFSWTAALTIDLLKS